MLKLRGATRISEARRIACWRNGVQRLELFKPPCELKLAQKDFPSIPVMSRIGLAEALFKKEA
jgi:hypothetical protein